MRAAGPDITRSIAGRLRAESVWLPSVLCDPAVRWQEHEPGQLTASWPLAGVPGALELVTDSRGALTAVSMQRWGDPGGGGFAWHAFGALVEEEAHFDGHTVPSRLRVGWHFDGSGFRDEGEFFRVRVVEARYC